MSTAGLRLALLAAAVALPCGGAQAKAFAGIVPDAGAPRTVIVAAQPSHSSPLARIANLPYEGGAVLHSNRTHLVFWAPAGSHLSYPPGYEALFEQFLRDVALDSHRPTNVYSLSGQYRDASGPAAYDSTYGGAVVATDALPRNGCGEPLSTNGGPGWGVCLSDAQVETEISRVIGAEHLPTTLRDVYFVVLPEGFGVCVSGGPGYCALGGKAYDGFCGYHSDTYDGAIRYAVIPYNAVGAHCQSSRPRPNSSPADPAISTLSHEHNETVTDPYSDAWIDSSGYEDGDLCLFKPGPALGGSGNGVWNQVIGRDHYYLQDEWSNWDGGCAARTQSDAVSFVTRSRPVSGQPLALAAHAHAAHGSITAYNWFFGDGGTSRRRSPTHVFRRAGSYRIVLRTTDSAGLWAFYAKTNRVGRGAKPRR